MCGICGAVWTSPKKKINPEILNQMTDRLAHRGPDDRGTIILRDNDNPLVPNVCLGFRRLAILDLSINGHQPMSNENSTVWIVFNGEIYNFEPLRKELINKGHVFKSNTDTEVLIHLYEEDQEKMLQKINGMFAFVIWDARKKRLFMARDRIGKKPFFYRYESDRLLFASELKSILTVNDFPREIDPVALDEYLTYQYVPYPKSIFMGISKLSPGHYMIWEANQLIIKKYWCPNFNTQNDQPTEEEWSEELSLLLSDAVKIRLRSDVPLGAFLSGGIDSSIISGIMQKESTQLIRTFTIGFTDKSADETKYAKVAATHFGTLHREFTVTSDIQSIFSKVAWYYDEPFADHSAIPTWFLCEQTRREVTVALTGDGGDELFAGYDRHRAANFRKRFDCLPLFCRRFLANHVKNMIPSSSGRSFFRKLQRFLEGLGMNQTECFLQWVSIINRKHRQKLYTNDFSKQLSGFDSIDHLKNAIKCCDKRDPATQLSLIDLQTYLPGAIMTKVDIASMAHSLECRSPFLDYRVVELASKIPLHYKIKGNISKTLLRNTYKNLIPPIIAKRHDKMGFSAPMFQWFRGPFKNLMNDTLLNSHAVLQGMFQREQIIRILSEHSSGQFDHSQMIWALFMFELWTRTWLENNSTI